MTPFELEICLHYFSRACDFREGDFSAPIVIPTLDRFVDEGLLMQPGQRESMKYGATQRLDAFVRHLCNQPLPIQKWVMPGDEE